MTTLAPPEINAVTPQQNEVLKYVIGAGRVTVRDAADHLNIDMRNARRRLDNLVRRHFLERDDGAKESRFSARISGVRLASLEVRNLRGVELTGARGATVNPQTAPRKAGTMAPTVAPYNAKETPDCPPHWWSVESPKGTVMLGAVCRKCGETREYVAAATELGNLPMVFPPTEKPMVFGGATEGARVGRDKHNLRAGRPASHVWGGVAISKESQLRSGQARIKGKFAAASSK